jgi:protein-S-isoprenylcysteine O-methyltransferase Ste14
MSQEHPWGDRGQAVALIVFMAVWLLDSFVLKVSTFLAQDVGLPIRLGASALVVAVAVYLIEGGHRAVSHESGSAARLITDGAFARVRHPLYAGCLMFYLSLVIATLSLVSLAVWGAMSAFYDFIASYEERRLAESYGAAYEAYRAKVPKWVPRLRAVRS